MLKFIYADADGVVSERQVARWSDDGQTFRGYCLARDDVRTFVKARVLEWLPDTAAVLISTGPPPAAGKRKASEKVLPSVVVVTGFRSAEKVDLEEVARLAGFHVAPSVGKRLSYLVCGDNAGPSKMEAARSIGARIVNAEEFRQICTC